MSVAIYVEGGGDSRQLKADCREGFRKFFENAGLAGRMPRVYACGSRNTAFDRFRTKLAKSEVEKTSVLLLVDSEEPVQGQGPWSHLERRDRWKRPTGADDDNVHLMVQCMESWFLADAERVAAFFGQDFKISNLPKNPNIEEVTTSEVASILKEATKQCNSGPYSKGRHSFRVLAVICPERVAAASPYARRLLDVVAALSAR